MLESEQQVTEYGDQRNVFDTRYGFIPFGDWCTREANRLTEAGFPAYIKLKGRRSNRVAVFRQFAEPIMTGPMECFPPKIKKPKAKRTSK